MEQHKDILVIEGSDGFGRDMTRRYLEFLLAIQKERAVAFDYDFVVLIDDDVYICLYRLFSELKALKEQKDHRSHKAVIGSFFCRGSDNTVPDERLLILSHHVVDGIAALHTALGPLNTDCAFGQVAVFLFFLHVCMLVILWCSMTARRVWYSGWAGQTQHSIMSGGLCSSRGSRAMPSICTAARCVPTHIMAAATGRVSKWRFTTSTRAK
jgi:hypothetical protein